MKFSLKEKQHNNDLSLKDVHTQRIEVTQQKVTQCNRKSILKGKFVHQYLLKSECAVRRTPLITWKSPL